MLTSDLVRTRSRGPYIMPLYVNVTDEQSIRLADDLVRIVADHKGKTRRELDEALDRYEGDSPDFKLMRGLAKLLADDCCEFEVSTVADPPELRREVFTLARENHPLVREADLLYPVTKKDVLEQVALKYQTSIERIEESLYADAIQNQRMSVFNPPTANWLLNRYNVALAQAMLYRCRSMRLSVHRNLPVRYKQLFKFIKFFRLIHSITGDLDAGYEVVLDGPVSMFRLSTKYGLHMARFLPALLLCTRWKMEAEVVRTDGRNQIFVLDESHRLVSHYRDQTVYDSLLEQTFAERFEKANTEWQLERETEIINLKDTVLIPDFAFRHPDGRTAILEIIGFWHPDYLRRKLDKLRRAQRSDLIVAVNSTLNVTKDDFRDIPSSVFFFKDKIKPEDVIERLEQVGRET